MSADDRQGTTQQSTMRLHTLNNVGKLTQWEASQPAATLYTSFPPPEAREPQGAGPHRQQAEGQHQARPPCTPQALRQ